MWIIYALLSAVFAALTTILAKIGIKNIDSHLATAIRTMFVVVMAWITVFVTGSQKNAGTLTRSNMIFLGFSGIATGLSWLCYYKALSLTAVSKAAPVDKLSIVLTLVFAAVFLKEPLTFKTVLGGSLVAAGTLVLVIGGR